MSNSKRFQAYNVRVTCHVCSVSMDTSVPHESLFVARLKHLVDFYTKHDACGCGSIDASLGADRKKLKEIFEAAADVGLTGDAAVDFLESVSESA